MGYSGTKASLKKYKYFYREQTDGCQRGGGLGEQYGLVVTEQSWDVKYSIGNIVNNILMTMCGTMWVLGISGETLCCTLEANTK